MARCAVDYWAPADRSGLSMAHLWRTIPHDFGFTPKPLMRRLRFMRVLIRAKDLQRGHGAEALAGSGYRDQAHFLRDCQAFLGMSLNRFLAMPKTMSEEVFRRRSEVLGAPVQTLKSPGG